MTIGWGTPQDWADATKTNIEVVNDTFQLATATPASVTNQYLGGSWSQGDATWIDEIGTADMTLTGGFQDATLGSSEPALLGDGVDDYGSADPTQIGDRLTWGIAFTMETDSIPRSMYFGRVTDAPNFKLAVRSGAAYQSAGDIQVTLQDDGGNTLEIYTDNVYDDGNPRAVVINKNGNSASNINIYVNDATTAEPTTVQNDQAFDHTNWSTAETMGFWTRDWASGPDNYLNGEFGEIQINTDTYTESERSDFISRQGFI